MTVFEGKRELLDAFRAGDRSALEVVYMRYVDDVFDLARYGFALGGGKRVPGSTLPDLQRDLVHDVFVRAFAERARVAYDGLRPYRPYLLRIARNAIIDAARRRGAVPLELVDDDVADPDPAAPPADDLDWQRLTSAARGWREGLDSECRELVRLRFEEDLGQREAAARMRATRRRVRTLEARVRRGLLAYLRELGLAD